MIRVARALSFSTIVILGLSAARVQGSGTSPPGTATPVERPEIRPEPLTPEQKAAADRQAAEEAYEAGYESVEEASALLEEAAPATAGSADEKTLEKTRKNREAASKKLKKAIEKFKKATELIPDYHEAWNMLGYAYRKTGQLGQAFKAYETCLKLMPDFEPAHEYLGEAHLLAGNPEKAKAELAWLKARKSAEASKLEEAITKHERASQAAQPGGAGW